MSGQHITPKATARFRMRRQGRQSRPESHSLSAALASAGACAVAALCIACAVCCLCPSGLSSDAGARDDRKDGGLVVCFGCRRAFFREPIRAVWHVDFCPKCAPPDDARWRKADPSDPLEQDYGKLWDCFRRVLGTNEVDGAEWVAN